MFTEFATTELAALDFTEFAATKLAVLMFIEFAAVQGFTEFAALQCFTGLAKFQENGVTRPRKYSKLTPADAIQADCDVKAINIILQGLPPEVYALVSNHKVAKELWVRIQLLMQGTSLTK
ncbi:hypothetical protein Tco_0999030 [Tanacetum coccineum]